MELYRKLLNNFYSVYIANNFFCSSETILVFRVHMVVFLELLSYGCCVDIQHCKVYNNLSHTARLSEKDISLLL